MSKNQKTTIAALADLETKDLAGLQELHSQMLATASDLAYEPPADVLVEIENEAQGRVVVQRLHDALTEHHERMSLAESGKKGDNEGQHGKPDTESGKKSGDKPTRKSSKKQAAANEGSTAAAQKEDTVATTPKKAPAKKAAAKKSVKKTAKKTAKKGAKAAGEKKPRGIDENAKIHWVRTKEGNGARPDTERFERRELLRKCSGQTVKSYLAKGGKAATLKRAVKDKDAKLEAPSKAA